MCRDAAGEDIAVTQVTNIIRIFCLAIYKYKPGEAMHVATNIDASWQLYRQLQITADNSRCLSLCVPLQASKYVPHASHAVIHIYIHQN